MAAAEALLKSRIGTYIHSRLSSGQFPGEVIDGTEIDDVNPNMRRFGDRAQSWYERNVKIGAFEVKADTVFASYQSDGK